MAIRRTKLICTLGPACDSVEGLKALIDAGMDVARFNFSHGTHAEHGARLERLREACVQAKKQVGVLQDLCGPKIRTGTFEAPFELKTGAEIVLVEGESTSKGDPDRIPITYEGLAADVRVGDRIMFDDGRIVLQVSAIDGAAVRAKVTQGGGMRSKVGVFLPTRTLRISPLTEKDKADLGFGLTQGVDYVALSFVRRAEDLRLVREICQEWGKPTPIIAKIETPDAVENLERSRRRVPARARARHPASDLARGPSRSAPRHRRDRDAPVDDEEHEADARRSERRRERGLRRRGLHHALG
jgi:pyruvate kinase